MYGDVIMDIKSYIEELERQRKEQDSIYHNAAVRYNLSDTAMWILYTVSDEVNEYSQQELCKMSYFAKQTINTAINSLINRGFITLESAEGSKKKKKIVLTTQGKEYAGKTTDNIHEAEKRAYKHFTDDELKFYLEMTRKITDVLRKETENQN